MRRRRFPLALVLILLATPTCAAAIAAGCSATGERHEFGSGGGTTGAGMGGSASGGGMAGGGTTTSSDGVGGELMFPDASDDVKPDVPMNPCGTGCGPKELCDPDHLGLDDNCDGHVDENCTCQTGEVHFCFMGDSSYRNTPGCFDGTERCNENGAWGPCFGGVHATQGCFMSGVVNCHPIQAAPFADVHLKSGTGQFSANAVPGSEVWTVTCPAGVSPCPAVTGMGPADNFKPLQSGEYTVKYTKGLTGGGTDSCTYPLFVGAPGLRVELEWEHNLGGTGVDLDLHVHQPQSTSPWSIEGAPQDCTWSSCTIGSFTAGMGPNWFNGTMPPAPVNWYLDPVDANNTCYFAPRGVGQQWRSNGMGCHNPRLDLDDVTCDPQITDVNSDNFCAPENVNIDFPPKKQWIRIGVHYYDNHDHNYPVHPRVKIYCNGELGGELGPTGYYDSHTPVTFNPEDGSGFSNHKFWLVADVAFPDSMCGSNTCVVKPLYADPVNKTPLFTTDTAAEANFGPAYPPPP